MNMDVVDGVVADVYDDSTFALRVTRSLAANEGRYSVKERVKVKGLDASACTWYSGDECSLDFLRRQRWHSVTCHVFSRSETGELVCDVLVRTGC